MGAACCTAHAKEPEVLRQIEGKPVGSEATGLNQYVRSINFDKNNGEDAINETQPDDKREEAGEDDNNDSGAIEDQGTAPRVRRINVMHIDMREELARGDKNFTEILHGQGMKSARAGRLVLSSRKVVANRPGTPAPCSTSRQTHMDGIKKLVSSTPSTSTSRGYKEKVCKTCELGSLEEGNTRTSSSGGKATDGKNSSDRTPPSARKTASVKKILRKRPKGARRRSQEAIPEEMKEDTSAKPQARVSAWRDHRRYYSSPESSDMSLQSFSSCDIDEDETSLDSKFDSVTALGPSSPASYCSNGFTTCGTPRTSSDEELVTLLTSTVDGKPRPVLASKQAYDRLAETHGIVAIILKDNLPGYPTPERISDEELTRYVERSALDEMVQTEGWREVAGQYNSESDSEAEEDVPLAFAAIKGRDPEKADKEREKNMWVMYRAYRAMKKANRRGRKFLTEVKGYLQDRKVRRVSPLLAEELFVPVRREEQQSQFSGGQVKYEEQAREALAVVEDDLDIQDLE